MPLEVFIKVFPLLSHKKHPQKVLFDWTQKPPIRRNVRFEMVYDKYFKSSSSSLSERLSFSDLS